MSISPLDPTQTRLHFDSPTTGAYFLDFSYIIFATQANQAKRLVQMFKDSTALAEEAEVGKEFDEHIDALGLFEYATTLVVNHYDDSILPAEADRRDLNLASFDKYSRSTTTAAHDEKLPLEPTNTLPRSSIQSTHIIGRTHPILTKSLPESIVLLQTTNPMVQIDPSLILSSTWYERAKLALASKQVLSRFILPEPRSTRQPIVAVSQEKKDERERRVEGDLQGTRSIFFVGSWCAEGVPLLEGCCTSAEMVVSAIADAEGLWAKMTF